MTGSWERQSSVQRTISETAIKYKPIYLTNPEIIIYLVSMYNNINLYDLQTIATESTLG